MDSDGVVRITVVITGVILAAAYIFLGPVTFRPKKLPVAGLVNLGNSCFLNAILQAIAPCIATTTWLQNISSNSQEANFAAILLQTIAAVNCPEIPGHTVLSAFAVLEALGRRCWVIGAGQQDAHEMYLCLTSTLEEELHDDRNLAMPVHVLAEKERKPKVGINRINGNLPRFDRKLDQRMPLRGLLASQLRCQRCGYKCPIKMETFDSLSVTIPPSQLGHFSLAGCLQHFMTAEKVHGVDCEGCTSFLKTKSKSTFLKRLTIAKCPQTLCIHISRTAWMDSGIPVKRHDHVSFPEVINTENFVNGVKTVGVSSAITGGNKQNFWTWAGGDRPFSDNLERISLNNFLMTGHLKRPSTSSVTAHEAADKASRPSSGNLYELKSVVEHVGDAYGGHFVTYRRGTPNTRYRNQWYSCSDTEIQEVSLREVLQCTAYLLFYERQQPRSSSAN